MLKLGELHRAKKDSKRLKFENKRHNQKFVLVVFPRNLIRNTIEYFNRDKDDFIIL